MKTIKVTEFPAEEAELIEIVKAEYLEGFSLRLWFNDGSHRIVDFGTFLRTARHPSLQKYRAVSRFKKFRILYGNLDWNDYEMCFPVADLYEGKV